MLRSAVSRAIFMLLLIVEVVTKDKLFRGDIVGQYKDVVTDCGAVRGRMATDGDYLAFLSIPYAAPPTGKYRFKAPSPPSPWNGVHEVNRTYQCPQRGKGQENCLVLNVFTPTKILNGPLAVLVYIHGGSYLIGSAPKQGIEPLIKQNIIVVTINYRLGVFGFLCLGIDEAPGNAGLKDQVAALKWVQDNIKYFGGDPKQVTIYGTSAGGASVEFHILSKMSEGLFQKAIVESGCSTSVWATDVTPVSTAMDFAKVLNFSKTINLYKLVDNFQHASAEELSKLNYEYYNNLTDGTFGFVPCVERRMSGTKPFLTDCPRELITKGRFESVPIMFLFATLEGLFLRSREYNENNYKTRMESNFLDFMPADLIFDTNEIADDVAKNIKRFYFGNNTVSDNSLLNYLNYFGDYLILHGLLNSAEAHTKGGNPVFLMEFSYKGNMGNYEEFCQNIKSAGHVDFVKHAILKKPIENNSDKLTVDRIVKLIGNFVKFGNPTPERCHLIPILWPPVQPNRIYYLHLNNDVQIQEEPYWGRKKFWDNIYSEYRNKTTADTGLI